MAVRSVQLPAMRFWQSAVVVVVVVVVATTVMTDDPRRVAAAARSLVAMICVRWRRSL